MWRHYDSKYKDLPPVMQAVIKQLTVNLTLVYLNYDNMRCDELSQYLRNNCIQCFQVEFNPRLKDAPAKGFMYMRKNKDIEAKAKLRHIVNMLWVYQFDLAKKSNTA